MVRECLNKREIYQKRKKRKLIKGGRLSHYSPAVSLSGSEREREKERGSIKIYYVVSKIFLTPLTHSLIISDIRQNFYYLSHSFSFPKKSCFVDFQFTEKLQYLFLFF